MFLTKNKLCLNQFCSHVYQHSNTRLDSGSESLTFYGTATFTGFRSEILPIGTFPSVPKNYTILILCHRTVYKFFFL